jgi:hypothetical protein
MVTRAREDAPTGDVDRVNEKCDVPLVEMVATASWWSSVKEGVVPARATVGHAIVARQRSTTLSARHQVENRWNMLQQRTFVPP